MGEGLWIDLTMQHLHCLKTNHSEDLLELYRFTNLYTHGWLGSLAESPRMVMLCGRGLNCD